MAILNPQYSDSGDYKLPFKVKPGEEYSLYIQKQPGTEGHEYTITVGGKKEKFKLTTDKELKFKL